jgi:hypothetical protein
MVASALLLLSVIASPTYGLTDLRVDTEGAGGVFLNDRGTVVGNMRSDGATSAPFVRRNGRLTRLKGVLRVAGLNARDQLAVEAAGGPGIWEAGKGVILWPRADSADLGPFVPRALGIDDSGNLVLVRVPLGSEGGNYRVVTWPKPSRIAESYEPVALSPDGSILARQGEDSRRGLKRRDAVLYDERSLQLIGEEDLRIDPVGVARGGWVCGSLSSLEDSREKPFVWHRGRFVRPFWVSEGKAVAVNDHGEAVGDGDGIPVLWTKGTAQELRTLIEGSAGYRLVEALAINGKGQILVLAEPKDRPFPRTLLLLTPKGGPRESG